MAIYRVAMSFPTDSALPKDVFTVNPHFNGSDPDALLQSLKSNLQNWIPIGTKPFTLKAYDAAKAPPSYPLATVTQAGSPPASGVPREVALCLSYYTTYNRPRYRGRLYIPATWLTSVINARPTDPNINTCLDFGRIVLTSGLPAATNWVLWSHTEKKSQGGVTDIWVDDEWDTVRSRGLKGTKRISDTVQAALAVVARAYSVRLLSSGPAMGFARVTIPQGYRAVLRHVDVSNSGTGEGVVYVQTSGINIWVPRIPGGDGTAHFETRQVMYAGEELLTYHTVENLHAIISGYLFEDSGPRLP